MDKFRVFVYMLMRDASLKQRIPCIMRISIFGAFSVGKKCALYTGKYGTTQVFMMKYLFQLLQLPCLDKLINLFANFVSDPRLSS